MLLGRKATSHQTVIPCLRHGQAGRSTVVFAAEGCAWLCASQGIPSHIPVSTFGSRFSKSLRMMARVIFVSLWEAIHCTVCFHVHNQAGGGGRKREGERSIVRLEDVIGKERERERSIVWLQVVTGGGGGGGGGGEKEIHSQAGGSDGEREIHSQAAGCDWGREIHSQAAGGDWERERSIGWMWWLGGRGGGGEIHSQAAGGD